MMKRNFTGLVCLVLMGLMLAMGDTQAQKWSGVNGNEWIVYGQSYVKVTVTTEGIQSVATSPLPAVFKDVNNLSKIQLWHRGVQVALLKADASEIQFYGVRNDGKSDEWLYRPGPADRVNKLVSLFSDNSAYFLTVGANAGLRAPNITQESLATPAQSESYHLNVDNLVYKDSSTHSTYLFPDPDFQNSFYEEGKSYTGPRLQSVTKSLGESGEIIIHHTPYYDPLGPKYNQRFKFTLNNLNTASLVKPTIKILVNGRSDNLSRQIKIHLTRSDKTIIRTITSTSFANFTYAEVSFDLEPTDIIAGEVYFAFESTQTHIYERFSVSYISIVYPQDLNMQSSAYYKLHLKDASELTSQLQVTGVPGGTVNIYDITNIESPKIISGSPSNFKVPRSGTGSGTGLDLLLTSQIQSPVAAAIEMKPVSLDKDFLILCADNLVPSATDYASFRGSTLSPKGERYKPVVLAMTDVYNQFNYGEPSPVATRRFVDYMLSGSDKNKYLLLIGKSITYHERVVREMPNEVPSIGYPGSDELLVDGLGGKRQDVPAIPVGRIPAVIARQVAAYLQKVKDYEFGSASDNDFSWRNNIIHVNGGDSKNQSESFRNKLATLATLNSITTPTYSLSQYVKGADVNGVVQQADVPGIKPLLFTELKNSIGVGMITFYGHGTTYQTDNNVGYISDPAKDYTASNKYSSLFFFGCDVNNVFQNFNGETVNNTGSRPLAVDWLLTPGKGSVTVFANSWDGYSTAFEPYMDLLYPKIFVADAQKKPLGLLLQEVADAIVPIVPPAGGRVTADYKFYQANIHQGVLLGDPAIKILNTTRASPLPVQISAFKAESIGNNRVVLKWNTAWEKNNSHFIVERSYNAKNFEKIGLVEGKGNVNTASAYIFDDNNPIPGINYYRLVQVDGSSDLSLEGKKTYSSIVSASVSDSELFVISPNPASSNVEIKLNGVVELQYSNLIDLKGNKLKTHFTGSNLNLESYPPGIYILEVVTKNNDVYRRKIIKQ